MTNSHNHCTAAARTVIPAMIVPLDRVLEVVEPAVQRCAVDLDRFPGVIPMGQAGPLFQLAGRHHVAGRLQERRYVELIEADRAEGGRGDKSTLSPCCSHPAIQRSPPPYCKRQGEPGDFRRPPGYIEMSWMGT